MTRKTYLALGLAGLLFTACTSIPKTENSQMEIADFVDLLVGEYDNHQQVKDDIANKVAKDDVHTRANRHFMVVDTPEVGNPVVLGTIRIKFEPPAWHFDKKEFFTWTFRLTGDGQNIIMSPQRFADPDKFIPYAFDAKNIPTYTPDDLLPAIGGASCDLIWTQTETGYSGTTVQPCHVPTRFDPGKDLHWTWNFDLTEERLSSAFKGVDPETGESKYKTDPGKPTLFYRIEGHQE